MSNTGADIETAVTGGESALQVADYAVIAVYFLAVLLVGLLLMD